MTAHSSRLRCVLSALLAVGTLTLAPRPVCADDDSYKVTNLVSDIPGLAAHTDPNLLNPWGISYSPTGPFWVSDNGSGLTTLYDGAGNVQPLVVTIPAAGGGLSGGVPTGQVFNGSPDFVVSSGGASGPALFIFAGEDGTISGWSPRVAFKHAVLEVDRSATGAVYKGLTIANNIFGNFLYAANFRSGAVDVFDKDYTYLGSFTDGRLPAGYAPFGIQNVNGDIVVTFAKQDAAKHDDVAGRGHGFVDVFSPFGELLSRIAQHGALNSPWGIALAPAQFGRFSNALLIGNFGDGRINAYSTRTGNFLGQLRDGKGHIIAIDGLWGLIFGNGGKAGDTHTLFFSAGPNHEADGLFGSLQAVTDGDQDHGD